MVSKWNNCLNRKVNSVTQTTVSSVSQIKVKTGTQTTVNTGSWTTVNAGNKLTGNTRHFACSVAGTAAEGEAWEKGMKEGFCLRPWAGVGDTWPKLTKTLIFVWLTWKSKKSLYLNDVEGLKKFLKNIVHTIKKNTTKNIILFVKISSNLSELYQHKV